jgi:RNA polymerase sigma factor (sigma-70 family)
MVSGQWAGVLRQVQRLFQGGSVAGLTEGQLLERFVTTRDEIAFGAIVARHGPMVLGVCRGVLNDPRDVEDAFQATFLILVKKARALRDRERLGPWLYGVARRVALRARTDASKRKEKRLSDHLESAAPDSTLDAELRELQVLIREEVDRLSNHDRMAVVLCYLEGLTHEEAADRLGWPIGTVKGRLSRAREKLRERLTRRGVTLPAVFSVNLGRSLPNLVPASLLQSTTLAATRLAGGQTLTAGIVSAQAILLMEGVIGTMFAAPLKIAAVALAAGGLLVVPGVLAYQGTPLQPKQQPNTTAASSPVDSTRKEEDATVKPVLQQTEDTSSTPEALVKLCEEALQSLDVRATAGEASVEKIYLWSRRMVEAQLALNLADADRKIALQAHLDRMRKSLQFAEKLKYGFEALEARFRVLEASRWVRDGTIDGLQSVNRPLASGGAMFGGAITAGGNGGVPRRTEGAFGGDASPRVPLVLKQTPADEKRNEAIRAKLDEPIAMNFAVETPLQEVRKYIKEKTRDPKMGFPDGIPIYFAPEGLQVEDKTIDSVIAINLRGIPLRTTLRLLLKQVGLDYRVVDGLVLISDEDSIKKQEPNDPQVMKENLADKNQNEAIRAKLDEEIAIDFGPETTLDEVKRYLGEKTRDERAGFPEGIPIYFNPLGLQDSEKTMQSTISMELRGVPLRTTLRLLLRQVGLIYKVTGGLLVITSEEPPIRDRAGFQ